jgi:pimeloyl-ACP methyl ester carboxylesterase
MRFCLVHGSTQNASGSKLLATELERRGHRVVCPDLPADKPEAGASYYVQAVTSALREISEPPIVVAHSLSGLFLPLIAAAIPVLRMVFLAATIPQIGKSALQQLQSEPKMICPEWIGKDPTKDTGLAMRFLFHDCSPEVAQWALSTLRLTYAHGALTEVFPLGKWPEVPSSYVLCTQDRTLNPSYWCMAARERLGCVPLEINAGHCPHVSRPAELAELLIDAGQSASDLD